VVPQKNNHFANNFENRCMGILREPDKFLVRTRSTSDADRQQLVSRTIVPLSKAALLRCVHSVMLLKALSRIRSSSSTLIKKTAGVRRWWPVLSATLIVAFFLFGTVQELRAAYRLKRIVKDKAGEPSTDASQLEGSTALKPGSEPAFSRK
jgi:hypothetical protein